jgi:hypothetical protein
VQEITLQAVATRQCRGSQAELLIRKKQGGCWRLLM